MAQRADWSILINLWSSPMNSAASKSALRATDVDFTATLEDGSPFRASVTELKSSVTPGRGDIWMVVATEWANGRPRTFTITFSKDRKDVTNEPVTDHDQHATVHFNNYEDPQNPTLQKARSGTITYHLNRTSLNFSGTFQVTMDKADGTGRFQCSGTYNTELS